MKITFHFRDDQAELLLTPENSRDDIYLNLLKGCEDSAQIASAKTNSLSILFTQRKLAE